MLQKRSLLALVTALSLSSRLMAQAPLALAAGAHEPDGPSALVRRALLAAALKPVYSLHLVSDWPQLGTPDGVCVNGGQETIDGLLELTSGGNYFGTLAREATIRFCGSHGTAAADACSLTLRSSGPVLATGEVYPFTAGWTNPVVELRWATPPEASRVAVEGNCPATFNESLRRMYLSVTHVLEFSLPVAGEGHRAERLVDYGWLVDVQ